MTLSHRALAVVLAAEAILAAAAGAVVLDFKVHSRAQVGRGVNTWGFRGTARVNKRPRGQRIAVVGGSVAYGYGVDRSQSFPYYLEGVLNQSWREKFPGTYTDVVNLATVTDGPGSYVDTLRDYGYLHPDAVCVYDGYGAPDSANVRRGSFIFRHTGYLPVLPAVMRGDHVWTAPERADVWPALDDRAGPAKAMSCAQLSAAYCAAMIDTVAWTLARGVAVVVLTPAYMSARHRAQQESLAAGLHDRFAHDPRFTQVHVGPLIDLRDRDLSFDGVHLTARGNQHVAEQVGDVFFDAIAHH